MRDFDLPDVRLGSNATRCFPPGQTRSPQWPESRPDSNAMPLTGGTCFSSSGRKFDRWLDLVFVQRLFEASTSPQQAT